MPYALPSDLPTPLPGTAGAFQIPGRFDPSFSLLGRLIRRRTGDELRAEAFFILALAGVALGLVLSHYLAWLLLVGTTPSGTGEVLAWSIQGGLVLMAAAICLVGFRPAIAIECRRAALVIRQGRRSFEVPYEEITTAAAVSGLLYHRHYRRYRGTLSFVNRIGAAVMLLHTPQRVVALGLSESDTAALTALLNERREVSVERALPALADEN